MQAEIYRIAEKIGELDEDINLENIYGLGLKATDPELRSLAIMQSKDDTFVMSLIHCWKS